MLRKQDKNINSPKNFQAAEHLRTQRPKNYDKLTGTPPGQGLHPTRLFYTITPTCQHKFNIKHQKFNMIKAAEHLRTQRLKIYV